MSVRRSLLGAVALVVLVGVLNATPHAGAVSSAPRSPVAGATSHCPWINQALAQSRSPRELANEVLARMTLREKASYVVLVTRAPLGNTNAAVPRLCLPPLTLSDGPDGLANGLLGVTQWPAEIALGATFSPSLARAYGVALGQEAAAKGLDAVQAPELNLARVSLSGRIFETFGEDPYLTGQLGAAEIEGIQSTGTISDVKHFGLYTQETSRLHLNQIITARALNEVYLAPFRQAVRQAHVASLMCAYGSINGVNTCNDAGLFSDLRGWGFDGFVRSDLHAALNVPDSLRAGVDVIKPTSVAGLVNLVRRGVVPILVLNRAVRDVLVTMFRFRLVATPRSFSPDAVAAPPGHADLALRIAEESMVLLKNRDDLLPLASRTRSLAVIGLDAAVAPLVSGGGSSAVLAPYLSSPLSALRHRWAHAKVTYQRGSTNPSELHLISDVSYQHGRSRLNGQLTPLGSGEPGRADLTVQTSPDITPAVATATRPQRGAGWNRVTLHLEMRRGGIYELAVQQYGDTWISLDGHDVLISRGIHSRNVISTALHLAPRRRYTVDVRWFAIRSHEPPLLGVLDVTSRIARAVAAARRARVAVVFAGAFAEEGADRSSLSLPGDQNALIAAVAAANPRTVVVLNSPGPVAMPWLHQVAAVVEAWYPGQVDGQAVAALLTGAVSPTGRLPVTFPAALANSPIAAPDAYPGTNATVNFTSGLDVGYRWYAAHHVRPLFPFGYGLSYTSFRVNGLRARANARGIALAFDVINTGQRSGLDVVEVYVRDPRALGEPPEQLRAVARVALAAGQRRRVHLRINASSLATYHGGQWRTSPGLYGVNLGSSASAVAQSATVRVP